MNRTRREEREDNRAQPADGRRGPQKAMADHPKANPNDPRPMLMGALDVQVLAVPDATEKLLVTDGVVGIVLGLLGQLRRGCAFDCYRLRGRFVPHPRLGELDPLRGADLDVKSLGVANVGNAEKATLGSPPEP